MLQQDEFSDQLHAEKYRGAHEDFRESQGRVAAALADDPDHFQRIRQLYLDQRFLCGGRIQASIGSTKATTAMNCYVSGTIADSFTDGPGNIMQRAHEAAATLRLGGGIGFDYSTLRPYNDVVKSLESTASGPVSFMGINNVVCELVKSAGHRRGAMMGVLRIDHPDIEIFIHAKQDLESLLNFNLSVAVTDEFMECLRDKRPFQLRFEGRPYRTIDPAPLWEMLMRSTWDWSEPGVLFIDHINKMNNLSYCEVIAATNPCSEQPMPPYGACCLGSFNLTQYVDTHLREFNYEALAADVAPVVRAMDNVFDNTHYPIPAQKIEALNKRRLGIGPTGLANAGEVLGHSYGSEGFLDFQESVLRVIRDEAYSASSDLAVEKGCFPAYDRAGYLSSNFVNTLPPHLVEKIERQGMRNSHLLTIAPTGTISLCAKNVSGGCEPVIDYTVLRKIDMRDGQIEVQLQDYGYREFGVKGKRAKDVTIDEHLAVLALATQYVDSGVSKTCNISDDMTYDEFKGVYVKAWELKCKGITTYRAAGKRKGIIESCEFDPETGMRSCE